MGAALALAAAVVSLVLVPVADAQPGTVISSFTYDASDATGQSLILQAKNTGANSLDTFVVELDASGTASNAVLTIGGSSYPTDCVGGGGGKFFPAVDCTFPTGLVAPGTSFTITFAVTPAYPANETNIFFADDPSGLLARNFVGPTPLPTPPPSDPTPPPSDPTPPPSDPTPPPSDPTPPPSDPTPPPSDTTPPPSDPTAPPSTTTTPPSDPITTTTPVVIPDQPVTACPTAGVCNAGASPIADSRPKPTPGTCKASGLSLTPDPSMLNKHEVGANRHNFDMALTWRLAFNSGAAGCRGTVSFGAPAVRMGTVSVPGHELHLSVRPVTFSCTGACTRSMTGRLHIKMLSRKQLRVLFGHTLAYKVTTSSGGVTSTHTVRVFVDSHGVLRRSG